MKKKYHVEGKKDNWVFIWRAKLGTDKKRANIIINVIRSKKAEVVLSNFMREKYMIEEI